MTESQRCIADTVLPRDEYSYVFFNNIHMTEDALRFKEIIARDPHFAKHDLSRATDTHTAGPRG